MDLPDWLEEKLTVEPRARKRRVAINPVQSCNACGWHLGYCQRSARIDSTCNRTDFGQGTRSGWTRCVGFCAGSPHARRRRREPG
jgi:hypothetical protein